MSRRPDIDGAPTVLALVLATVTSVACGLVALAVLFSSEVEPACDPGVPGSGSPSCRVGADDLLDAAPFAAAALVSLVCVAVLYRLSTTRATAGGERLAAQRQARTIIAVTLGAVVGAVCLALASALT